MAKNENKEMEAIAVVANIIVDKDGNFLMVQEGHKDVRVNEKYNIPGGRQDEGEEPKDCAVRECREETGFWVKVIYEIGIYTELLPEYGEHGIEITCTVFKSEIVGGELTHPEKPGEIMDVGWFSFEQIKELNKEGELVFPYVWEVIQAYNKGERK